MSAARRAVTKGGMRALPAAAALLGLAVSSGTATAAGPPVRVATGNVAHVRGTTAQLNGVVVAPGITTSVFFKYGPTLAFGHVTKALTVAPPSPPRAVKVGEQVTGLLAGWHYQICATYTNPANAAVETVCDTKHDRTFTGGSASSKFKFVLPKGKEERLSVIYGGTLELTGSLTGKDAANHGLSLQTTPFPYTDPFTTVVASILSSRTGSFVFRVPRMLQDTQLRILTTDTRPIYSPIVTVHVTPRITLHFRSAGKTGLYRFYGTVAPARPGAQLTIQELEPQKASSKRSGPAAHTVISTVLRKATKTVSRFSVIVNLSGTSHYRAFVRLPKGALESGSSANVLIKAPKGAVKHKKRR
jgi:hypothetical protein